MTKCKLDEVQIKIKMEEKREKQKYYYNRNAKSLPVLSVGDLVIFKKNGKEWHYGTIVAKFNDRSYIIKDSFDNHFRRNRRFIAKTVNADFNASDLLYEENLISQDGNATNSFKEIQIVDPPRVACTENIVNQNEQIANTNDPVDL